MPDSFRGEFAAKKPLMSKRLRESMRRINDVEVVILVWGPGPHPSDPRYYDKRMQIYEHLEQENPRNEVVTSEELIEAAEEPDMFALYQWEAMHLGDADIVFVLIPDERKITGSQAEVLRYFDLRHFNEKGNVIAPLEDEEERANRGFLNTAWKDFPQRFEYTDEQFEQCVDIRDFCSRRVKEVRGEIGWERYDRELRYRHRQD